MRLARFRHDIPPWVVPEFLQAVITGLQAGRMPEGYCHSVEGEPNPASPACLVCRFARTAFLLLPVGTLWPKAEIANPALAAKKKLRPKVSSGKLFLMDSSTPMPNEQPTPKPIR